MTREDTFSESSGKDQHALIYDRGIAKLSEFLLDYGFEITANQMSSAVGEMQFRVKKK